MLKRILQGLAYMLLGLLILAACAVFFLVFREEPAISPHVMTTVMVGGMVAWCAVTVYGILHAFNLNAA